MLQSLIVAKAAGIARANGSSRLEFRGLGATQLMPKMGSSVASGC